MRPGVRGNGLGRHPVGIEAPADPESQLKPYAISDLSMNRTTGLPTTLTAQSG